MLFGSRAICEEIREQGSIINAALNNIKDDIPYQSEIEKENNMLLDSNVKLKKQVEELKAILLSVQGTNENLVKYIENIEEVKRAGGIKCSRFTHMSLECEPIEYEKKIIPSLVLFKRVEEKNDN